jgi:uncharacterized protein YktB (UPF0637 family)
MMNEKVTNMTDKEIYVQIAKEINQKFGRPDDAKFAFCISNPPYQKNDTNRINIYDKFYFIGAELSKKMSLIFPLG